MDYFKQASKFEAVARSITKKRTPQAPGLSKRNKAGYTLMARSSKGGLAVVGCTITRPCILSVLLDSISSEKTLDRNASASSFPL